MEIDYDKIDECTLALLYLGTSEGPYGARAWRAFDQSTMDRLHQKGYISDPKSKALRLFSATRAWRGPGNCSNVSSPSSEAMIQYV